jgi:acetolactate synthase-1/2/3 large subunit
MTTADYITGFLRRQGVTCVFEMAGGMITYLLDSIYRQGDIRIVSMHHEQAAGFAADATGRITGIPGVVMATSGPGATNLVTAIADCYFDSVPCVFITGQVNTHELSGNSGVRQLGFQETDIVSIVQTVTKAAWRVHTPAEVPGILAEAFRIATDGRPGPVLVDIPMDVQRSSIPDAAPYSSTVPGAPRLDSAIIADLVHDLANAKRPLILAGGGIRASRSIELFRTFAHQVNVPVVNSLMAVDVLPYGDPLRVGLIGTYGNRWANWAMGKADLLLVLGSRLDVRQTGADTGSFRGDKIIWHVDCDPAEMNNRVAGCNCIESELTPFLDEALHAIRGRQFAQRTEWLNEIAKMEYSRPDTEEQPDLPGINPNVFMHQLSRVSFDAAVYTADVGQHQMWAAQSLDLRPCQRFLTSGGLGSMGFALPAGIGAAFASGGPVVVIAGDGGFQCNIQELQTIVHHRLPIKMVVINNGCLGMVRQFQQSYFESRYQSTVIGYSSPEVKRVALAYGIDARTIDNPIEVCDALEWLWSKPNAPALLDVMIDRSANAYPKTAYGRPITEMEPHIMEATQDVEEDQQEQDIQARRQDRSQVPGHANDAG